MPRRTNAAQAEQFVLVENSLTGDTSDLNIGFVGLIPLVPASNGLKDARVILTHLNPGPACQTPSVALVELEDYLGVLLPTDTTIAPGAAGIPRGAYVTRLSAPYEPVIAFV